MGCPVRLGLGYVAVELHADLKRGWPVLLAAGLPAGHEPAPQVVRNASYEAVVSGLLNGGVSPRYVLDLVDPYTGPGPRERRDDGAFL